MKKWNLDPALKWALDHEEQLNKRNSVLIFQLYKLKFIEMLKKIDQKITEYNENGNLSLNSNSDSQNSLQNGNLKNGDNKEDDETMIDNDEILNNNDLLKNDDNLNGNNLLRNNLNNGSLDDYQDYISRSEKELIAFARTNFQPYFTKYGKDIQQLMCCLLYLPSGIRKCKYQHLFEIPESEVVDLFTREACSLLGLSVESPLIVTFNAGCKALPALINIRFVNEFINLT